MKRCLQQSTPSNDWILTSKTNNHYEITNIDILNPLGKGSFAVVYKAKNIATSQYVAIKKMQKGEGNNYLPTNRIKEEILIMEKITTAKYFNLLNIIEWCEDDNCIYIITPLCDTHNLTSYINSFKFTSEEMILECFRKICYGMKMLHKESIIHRDLKTDNILLYPLKEMSIFNYSPLIADFGLSKVLIDQFTNTYNVGTAYTRAPEVYTSIYSFGADVYSLGCILYKMITFKELLHGNNDSEFAKVQRELQKANVSSKFQLSELTLCILEGCLQFDSNERITMSSLCDALGINELYTNYCSLNLSIKAKSNIINLKKWETKNKLIIKFKINTQKAPTSEEDLVPPNILEQLKKNDLEINLLTSSVTKLSQEMSSVMNLKQANEILAEQIESNQKEIKKLKSTVKSSQSAKKDEEIEENNSKVEIKALKTKMHQMKKRITALESSVSDINTSIESSKEEAKAEAEKVNTLVAEASESLKKMMETMEEGLNGRMKKIEISVNNIGVADKKSLATQSSTNKKLRADINNITKQIELLTKPKQCSDAATYTESKGFNRHYSKRNIVYVPKEENSLIRECSASSVNSSSIELNADFTTYISEIKNGIQTQIKGMQMEIEKIKSLITNNDNSIIKEYHCKNDTRAELTKTQLLLVKGCQRENIKIQKITMLQQKTEKLIIQGEINYSIDEHSAFNHRVTVRDCTEIEFAELGDISELIKSIKELNANIQII